MATATVELKGDERAEWLALRRTGIGSSDAAAICGLDPYKSALEVYLDKVGEAEERSSDAMHWGNRLEGVVADHFEETTDWDVDIPEGMVRSEEFPFMCANVDRWLSNGMGETALLEIKTTGAHMAERWEHGPPDNVLVQVQHQLAVTGLSLAFVAVLVGGNDYRVFEVERDEELVASLQALEGEFWDRVQRRDPPPPDSSESATRALRRLYGEGQDIELDLPPEAEALIDAYKTSTRMQAELKEEHRRLANAIKALLGEASVGLLGGKRVVSWSRWTQQRLDRETMEADHPELVAKYLVPDPRDRLTLTKARP